MENEYYYTTDTTGKVYRYQILQDEDGLNPREDFDNACEMYIWWGRYILGDNKGTRSAEEIIENLCDKYLPDYDYYDASINQMIVKLQSKATDKIRIYPIFVYDHSGITISMSDGYPYNDRWDGGVGGFMIAEKEKFDKCGYNWDMVYEIAEGEVDDYDMYLVGDVYGYVEDTYIGDGEWEENTESVWGYFSRKWGKELACDVLEKPEVFTEYYDEEKIEELCEAYDKRRKVQAEYGLWMMEM